MKKIVMMIAVAGLLASCGGNTQKNQEEQASVEEFTEIAKNVKDEHNAKNSLDYKGTYKGEIPAADASGIIVSVTLSDSTYVKTMKYIGKGDKTFEDKGKYTWNDAGNTITLEGLDGESGKYFVGENTLIMLDMEGNKITGELADKYILRK
ncbi:putative lipoprotein NlpE involved in copper resistance [Dysgonomonas hofstadii]|uniref:Putative lipoprotein NlpE involved in copper resistance n=1 Tax=Dysgonomonas hofstadii TaxID=637886 RepID=A0A840CJ52_9BACT|nr:copper resistance protein NlpE [Dysgonomonas hofstadii]MBB4034699.1 putative lipoprotein NlpE involved in copper resistance [Dysgonomonas hofstadii]